VLGDLNSTYFGLFYSLTNAAAAASLNGNCPFELVLVGYFPQGRYFSITDNDMHYALAQHLLDADIDPVGVSEGDSYTNPYTPGVPYYGDSDNHDQEYLVPISFGNIPGLTTTYGGTVLPACAIDPFEGDNLLDATQRHQSMDWNTVLQSALAPTDLHVVDNASHGVPNTAGEIMVRSYLEPAVTCSAPGSCSQPQTVQPPYLFVRDVYSGCAYPAQWIMNNALVSTVSLPGQSCNAGTCPTDGTAFLTIGTDPSAPGTDPSYYTDWLSQQQQGDHTAFTQVTPQACYANGNPPAGTEPPTSASPNFYNKVAWVRGPEWVGRPGPDDAYIAGQISTTELQTMEAGSERVIRMQFLLPTMPAIPCSNGCSLNATEPLRYWSLSVVQATSAGEVMAADPDGVDPANDTAQTLVSLADTAFTPNVTGNVPGNFVTLLVGVGQDMSSLTSGATPALEGAERVDVEYHTDPAEYAYTVLNNASNYYTYLGLSKFPAFNNQNPLQLVIRTTLPNTSASASFGCSGFAVPFNTAEYTNTTNGAGLMGPYVPLVDYVNIQTGLPSQANTSSSNLPSASSCGQIPGGPTLNGSAGTLSYPTEVTQWPTYWTSTAYPAPLSLTCGTQTPPSPSFYFATSQWPYSVEASNSSLECTVAWAKCTSATAQTLPAAEQTEGQPPLPTTLVGTGFGYLKQYQIPGNGPFELDLPFLPPTGYASSQYLAVQNERSGTTVWNTIDNPSCQVYIANWTGTSISFIVGAPVDASDQYGIALSILNDLSPLSFFYQSTVNTMDCSISPGDLLTFTVTNPESGNSSPTPQACVQPSLSCSTQ
jgi:hypothetical protein